MMKSSLVHSLILVMVALTGDCYSQQNGRQSVPPTPSTVGYSYEFESGEPTESTEPIAAGPSVRFAVSPTTVAQSQYVTDEPDSDQDSEPMPLGEIQFDPMAPIPFDTVSAAEPSQMLEQINSELTTSMGRELSQIQSIKQGLEQLRTHNQSLREAAIAERRQAEAARRRAYQSDQLVEEAKRSAEEANSVALETMSRISQLEQRLVEMTNPPAPVVEKAPELPKEVVESIAEVNENEVHRPASRPITDTAVDRQALADNLFGAKEFRLAMQVYGRLADDPPEGADVSWFKFQIAGCLRNLKEFEKAERYYRIVVGSKDPLLAPTARWWLSNIEEQKTISEQLARWEGFLKKQEAGIEQSKRSG